MGIRIDREYHPPSEEYPKSREFAPLGDEYNADAADPPRRAKKRLWTSYAIAAAVTVTLLCSTAISSGEESTAATVPPPSAEELETEPALVETTEPGQLLLTLAEAVERYPDWYDGSKDIWLHFEGNEGWFSNGQFFHRFIWQATGDFSGVSTMTFCDIGRDYSPSGSIVEPVDSPMTLLNENGGCRLLAASGMGEGGFGSSSPSEESGLTLNSFTPAEAPGVDGSGMEGILGKSTEELLTGIAGFTADRRVSGTVNTEPGAGAEMTALYFGPGGSGTLTYDDGTVVPITWSVIGDYGGIVNIGYEDVVFPDGSTQTYMAAGGLTLTADGPCLWLYNYFTNMEVCFVPE